MIRRGGHETINDSENPRLLIATKLQTALKYIRALYAKIEGQSSESIQRNMITDIEGFLSELASTSFQLLQQNNLSTIEIQNLFAPILSSMKDLTQGNTQNFSMYNTDHTNTLEMLLSHVQIQQIIAASAPRNLGIMFLSHMLISNGCPARRINDAIEKVLDPLETTLFLFPLSSGALYGSLLAEELRLLLGIEIKWHAIHPSRANIFREEHPSYTRIIVLDDIVAHGGTLESIIAQIEKSNNIPVFTAKNIAKN